MPASTADVAGRAALAALVVIGSLVLLAPAAWLVAVFVHGLSGPRTVSEIATDYALIGLVYVPTLATVLARISRQDAQHGSGGDLLWTVSTLAAFLPLVSVGTANVVIETREVGSDEVIAIAAVVAAVVLPVVLMTIASGVPRSDGPTR